MARFDVTHAKAGVNTANTQMWAIHAGASNRVLLWELGLSVAVAPTTGPSFRLNRATAAGTASTSVVPQPQDVSVSAALTRLDTAWSAAPTNGGTDLRTFAVPNSIGSGIVWTWYDLPFYIPAATSLVIINGNATGATLGTLNIYAVIDE